MTRETLIKRLKLARERFQPGQPINAEDLHASIDAALYLLDPPESEEPDPWDDLVDAEERAAIESEPPSVYYLLRHPRI